MAIRDRWLAVAVAACLAWAGVEARGLVGARPGRPDPCAGRPAPAAEVEDAFLGVRTALAAGRRERALFDLRRRAEHGPFPGYAEFWLGELAYEEGAYPAAVRHYRAAVDREPAVYDRGAAFGAGKVVAGRLEALRSGPWARNPPPEVRDLYYLQRRIAGGCE